MEEEEYRKHTLDRHIDEKFAEIFFIAKEEYDIGSNTQEEDHLYDLLNKFKLKLKERCEAHFNTEE